VPGLSIIIPTYDEERKIARDVREASAFLSSHGLAGEIIVSDDGSGDGTVRAAQAAAHGTPIPVSVLTSEVHRGKGAAVRSGVLASRGEYVMFADSGMTVPYDNALRGLRLLRDGSCHLAHGSRHLPESKIVRDRDSDRKAVSSLFRTVAALWLGLPHTLSDTQCGFKMYRGEVARRLYAASTTDGFLFDLEIILRALREGLSIREFPVEWSCDRDSRIGLRRNALEVLRDLVRLRPLKV
jgi:dolichyl-phosphate beta-glucosyltransferase